jgi:hypothetical protein
MRLERIPEPQLFFGGNKSCTHAQVGLLAYGPHSGAREKPPKTIRYGVLGTKGSIDQLKVFLKRLEFRIQGEEGDTDYDEIDFPGLTRETSLGFALEADSNAQVELNPTLTRELEALPTWRDRAEHLMAHYETQLTGLTEIHPAPNIFLLPLDQKHIQLCKNPAFKQDKIKLEARRFDNPSAAKAPWFDFHNRIKAVSAGLHLKTQIVRPSTTTWAKGTQDPSIVAWNFAVGLYYKATGLPWKLADLDESACHVGLSFYQDFSTEIGNMSAAVAQVYLRTGESQVIRGESFAWDPEKDGRDVFLDASHMKRLIRDSIELFEQQRGKKPSRVSIHKPGPFNADEIGAIQSSLQPGTVMDAIHIRENTRFRAYYKGHDYPMVRGTAFLGEKEGFLFTTGFTPAMNTYKGAAVPEPIQFRAQHLETNVTTVARDLMGLTKLDWNTTAFNTRVPVTVSVSSRVGEVMAETRGLPAQLPTSYAHFM